MTTAAMPAFDAGGASRRPCLPFMSLLGLALLLVIALVPLWIGALVVGAKRSNPGICFLALIVAAFFVLLLSIFVRHGLLLSVLTSALAYALVLEVNYLKALAIAGDPARADVADRGGVRGRLDRAAAGACLPRLRRRRRRAPTQGQVRRPGVVLMAPLRHSNGPSATPTGDTS